MDVVTLQTKLEQLPDPARASLNEYLDFLLAKYSHSEKNNKEFKFDWEGGLSELRNKYTSVELQHKISGWR